MLLRQLVDAVAAGAGGVVLIEGEPGAGKSALLQAGLAGAVAVGCEVLWGGADELARQVLGPGGRWSASVPTVLVVEDLQRADEADVRAWYRLGRITTQQPLLLAGSCRPGEGQDIGRLRRGVLGHGGHIVPIGPLAETEVAEVATYQFGARPGPVLARVLSRAGGNPRYLGELMAALAEGGQVKITKAIAELASDQVPLPSTLAASIDERLAVLPLEAREILRWAAILGREFLVTDLEVVTQRTAAELMGALEVASEVQLVAEAGPRLMFRHGLVRQALYEETPVPQRPVSHLQAAAALAAAGAAAEQVARQLTAWQELAAGPGQPRLTGEHATWVPSWLATASRTLIYRMPELTASLLRATLAQLAEDSPRRADLELSLARAAFLLRQDDEVEVIGGQLLDRDDHAVEKADVVWLVGSARARSGRLADAMAIVTGALSWTDISAAQAALLRALRSMIVAAAAGRPEATVNVTAEVARSALATGETSDDQPAVGYALHALFLTDIIRPEPIVRLAHIDQALLLVGSGLRAADLRLMLLVSKAQVLELTGRQAEAISTAARAVRLAEQTGSARLGEIRCLLAWLQFWAGDWDASLAQLDLVGDHPRATAGTLARALAALIAGHQGQRQAAGKLAHASHHAAQAPVDPTNPPIVLLAQSLAAERAGRLSAAASVLKDCLQGGPATGMSDRPLLLPALARLAMATDDQVTAAAAAEAAADDAAADPLPARVAAADHCRGLATGDPDPVLAAASYYEGAGRPLEQAQALENSAMLAAAQGQPTVAVRRTLARVVRLYSDLGARWDLHRMDEQVERYGARSDRTGSALRADSGWDALTPAEVKVANLVARGRSNPDIAAELYLSRNTVQTHVSHILAKLGARARAEIISEVLRRSGRHQAGTG